MMRPPPPSCWNCCIISRAARCRQKKTPSHDPVDAVRIRLGQVHDVGVAGDAGIVDDDVEPAQFGDGARHHRVDRGDVAAIGLDRDGAARIGRAQSAAVRSAAARWGGDMEAPSSAIASAIAGPIPAPAPVTSTTLSCNTAIAMLR